MTFWKKTEVNILKMHTNRSLKHIKELEEDIKEFKEGNKCLKEKVVKLE